MNQPTRSFREGQEGTEGCQVPTDGGRRQSITPLMGNEGRDMGLPNLADFDVA